MMRLLPAANTNELWDALFPTGTSTLWVRTLLSALSHSGSMGGALCASCVAYLTVMLPKIVLARTFGLLLLCHA